MAKIVLNIEKLIYGGEGLARLSKGKVVFVPYTLPHEKVLVEIKHDRGDFLWGYPIDILSPSPYRQSSLCPYFPSCGGCQWQHITYKAQLRWKKKIFQETLARIGKLNLDLDKRVIASPKTLGYRHKLQFHVHSTTGKLGFLKRKSHELVCIKNCALAFPEINKILLELPEIPAWKRIFPFIKRLTVSLSLLEKRVVLFFRSKVSISSQDLEEIILKLPLIKAIFFMSPSGKLKGPFPPSASYYGKRLFPAREEDLFYLVSPGVFVQNNWEINLLMISHLKEIICQKEKILDLHCGMGNFLLPLAKFSSQAQGIDTEPRAIMDAKENAKQWGLGSMKFYVSSAKEAILKNLKEGDRYPLVLLDPPRGGCREILNLLPEIALKEIVYISCDPPSLARDLKILIQQGYRIKNIELFDMFPQTFHLESITFLSLS